MREENNLDNKIQKWFVIYTRPRAEKKVAEQLAEYNYQVYLPLKKEVRQWKDRLKKVELPLFNSYVFVKVDTKQYYEIPKLINGFVKYITIGGEKIAVREEEIESIKKILNYSSENIEISNERFNINDKIEIKLGQLKGLKGSLIEFKGKYKIAISIKSIGTSLIVEINKNAVKKAK